MSSTTKKNLYL